MLLQGPFNADNGTLKVSPAVGFASSLAIAVKGAQASTQRGERYVTESRFESRQCSGRANVADVVGRCGRYACLSARRGNLYPLAAAAADTNNLFLFVQHIDYLVVAQHP